MNTKPPVHPILLESYSKIYSPFTTLFTQRRTGQIIGSPEKTAYEQGFITAEELTALADPLKKSGYGKYLIR